MSDHDIKAFVRQCFTNLDADGEAALRDLRRMYLDVEEAIYLAEVEAFAAI